MIAVTFALPSESSDFRRLLGGRHREVNILHTGVGADHRAALASNRFSIPSASTCLSAADSPAERTRR